MKNTDEIPDNNGWIEVSEDTELTISTIYWFYNDNVDAMWTSFVDDPKNFYSKGAATHYQAIFKPERPVLNKPVAKMFYNNELVGTLTGLDIEEAGKRIADAFKSNNI